MDSPQPPSTFVGLRPKRNSRSEFEAMLTEQNVIVAPATIGGRMPSAASGIAVVL